MTGRSTPALMLQGTGSDVGKSLIVAGLCRAYARRGLNVRPFKPQNMSNNAAVTDDGREIGRAQALQARACGVTATVDMNPVLLKPESEGGAQIVVQGRVLGHAAARDYHGWKPRLLPAVLESFHRLAAAADLVVVEGAGSPAEVNLRAGDIANMGFAEAADVPVVLIADVERGGAVASLVGTMALLPEAERARIAAYIVNKFRGDARLFDGAVDVIATHTGLACAGVVPYFAAAARLPAEDSLALHPARPAARRAAAAAPIKIGPIKIVVPRFARIANFDDLDPLAAEPDVALDIVEPGRPLPMDAALILLPGSKSTRAELDHLRAQGWDIDIRAAHRQGAAILGICAGYQVLGRSVADPGGVEGPPGTTAGLGLLDVTTVMSADKMLRQVSGTAFHHDARFTGYEMHVGRTTGPDCARPLLRVADGTAPRPAAARPEGARSADGRVAGCTIHGLFAADAFRHAFLATLDPAHAADTAYEATIETTLDALADHMERHLDLDRLLQVARARVTDA